MKAQSKGKTKSNYMYVWWGCLALALLFFVGFSHFDKSKMDNQEIGMDMTAFEKMSVDEKSKLSKEDWAKYLTPEQFNVMKEEGTEVPFTSELLNEKRAGTYVTADCGIPVFRSETKYDSKTGWPSYYAPIKNGTIELVKDTTLGYERVEVREKTCGTHLGHVFDDGPAPTGDRYCINGVALRFVPDEE